MDIFDCMAKIARLLQDKKFDSLIFEAVSVNDMDQILAKENELLLMGKTSWDNFMEKLQESYDEILYMKLLQSIDKIAYEELNFKLWRNMRFPEKMYCQKSLNVNYNQTHIMIIPRYNCIWNGKSKEKNHIIEINTYLNHFYCVEITDGKLDGKYDIQNYILNPSFYGVALHSLNELFVQLAVSPLSKDVELDINKYSKINGEHSINHFSVNEISHVYQTQLIENIIKVILKSDKRGDRIIVFPEMLGTQAMLENLKQQIRSMDLKNLYFILFPSIWKKEQNGDNTNISYVIDSYGEEWFGQSKLKRFILKENDKYIEDIIEGDTIHIIHCEGYGSIAIAICRSELEEDIKEILIRKLNIKLILCPSWTQGYNEFQRSFMNGAERNCNVAWCNACSAVNQNKNVSDKNIVGMITAFGKNHEYSRNDFVECTFPADVCNGECQEGCLFSKKIYGTDYKKEWDDDGIEEEYDTITQS